MDNETMTHDDRKKLENELAHLVTVSSGNKKVLNRTWAVGNTRENPAYETKKREQEEVEKRIHDLRVLLQIEDKYIRRYTMETFHREKDTRGDIDINAAIIADSMRSLGYYADYTGYESVKVLTNVYIPSNIEEYTGPLLMTNADMNDFYALWDAEYMDEDQYHYKYDPAVDISSYYSEDGWWYPGVCETGEPDMMHCAFPGNKFVDVKINQPNKYRSDKVICFYSKGDYPEFSNFYPAEMDAAYASVEHYFQIMKAREFDPDGEALKQMGNHLTCAQIKSLGRKVQNFDAKIWNIRRRFHMRDALYMKFTKNPALRELLLSTGDAVLAEASPRDTFWGIGYGGNNPKALDPSQWRGKNVLGNMLMFLRDEMREGINSAV